MMKKMKRVIKSKRYKVVRTRTMMRRTRRRKIKRMMRMTMMMMMMRISDKDFKTCNKNLKP